MSSPSGPENDGLRVPDELATKLELLGRSRGWSREKALRESLRAGIAAIEPWPGIRDEPTRDVDGHRAAAVAAWRVASPVRGGVQLQQHEWAENLVPRLPLRFQKYAAELLFDDERVLFLLHRPAAATRAMLPWRRRRENEGVFLVTDRMVMFMQDAIPPGPMFVDWGYEAWLTAVERVTAADVVELGGWPALRVVCRSSAGQEARTIPFPDATATDLADAAFLLGGYGHANGSLPARLYAERVPAWESPDARAARKRIAGRAQEERDEADTPAIAEASDACCELKESEIAIKTRRRSLTLSVSAISSVRVWRAVTGCSLTFAVPGETSAQVVFQYPQSTPFLRIAQRVRHLMGRPTG